MLCISLLANRPRYPLSRALPYIFDLVILFSDITVIILLKLLYLHLLGNSYSGSISHIVPHMPILLERIKRSRSH